MCWNPKNAFDCLSLNSRTIPSRCTELNIPERKTREEKERNPVRGSSGFKPWLRQIFYQPVQKADICECSNCWVQKKKKNISGKECHRRDLPTVPKFYMKLGPSFCPQANIGSDIPATATTSDLFNCFAPVKTNKATF